MQSWTLTYGTIASSLAISSASRVVVEHRNQQPEISMVTATTVAILWHKARLTVNMAIAWCTPLHQNENFAVARQRMLWYDYVVKKTFRK